MSGEVEGLDRLQRTLMRLADPGQVVAAVRPAAQRVGAARLKRAKQLAPRMDSILVNSGFVQVTVSGVEVSVEVGFNAPYARAVHENPRSGRTGGVSPRGRKYRKWAKVGEYRYLQKAVDEGRTTDMDMVAEGVNAWLRRQAS